MRTVALEKTQATLADLVREIANGEELIITEHGEPKAKLSPVPSRKRTKARAGSLGGKIWMSPDFDVAFDDFKGYMK